MQGGRWLYITGATKAPDSVCVRCNGFFDLTPEILNGRSVFRKRGGDHWLYFSSNKKHWLINDSAGKHSNSVAGYAYALSSDGDLPPVSGWSLSDGKNGVADAGVTVMYSGTLKSKVTFTLCPCCSALISISHGKQYYCSVASRYPHTPVYSCVSAQ